MKFIVHYKYLKISADGSSYKSISIDGIECDDFTHLEGFIYFYDDKNTVRIYNRDSVIKVEVQND